MVIITNISNKPVGIIGGEVCLPNKSIVVKDKDAMCDVFDENNKRTGKRKILPGLKAMENVGYIRIEVKEDEKPEEPAEEPVNETAAEAEEEVVEAPKKTTRKRTTKKTTE